jgi:non-ribosomal peptide synthetase component F
VGVYLPKSIDAVAAIHGVMRAGAAYVPIDTEAPPARAAYILNDCGVALVVLAAGLEAEVSSALEAPGRQRIVLQSTGGGVGLTAKLNVLEAAGAPAPADVQVGADALACILYTSGSTGRPKGVMLSHENACSFVAWCSSAFLPKAEDRFSSHAPFHFDLSILDLYLPVRHAATLVLVPSAIGKEPVGLAAYMAERRLTVWYSTPSILSMLAEHGKMNRHAWEALRTVLFAGEVFPVKHLRALAARLPHVALFNLYGPTETNVCTCYRFRPRYRRTARSRFRSAPFYRTCTVALWTRRAPMSRPARKANSALRGRTSCRVTGTCPSARRARFCRAPVNGTIGRVMWLWIRAMAFSRSSAAATAWSSGAATGSSWARSRPGCTAIQPFAKSPSSPLPMSNAARSLPPSSAITMALPRRSLS